MRLYNTLTRRVDLFEPVDGKLIRMYTCGLTVYDRGHIGNFRTFVCLDVLRRYLRHHLGYRVHQVMNFTDVDDRTIAGAERAGMPLREYTDRFIAAYYEDAEALGLEPAEENPRATEEENLRAMVRMIEQLEANHHTYRSDGSVYFKISTFPDYGKLARLDLAGMQAGARVDSDTYEKEDARDFVLWKASKDGEPIWDFGVGPGRPGWHIECSAMALRLLGEPPIDLHAGGTDLIFPHHENEIAQSEGARRRQFSRFWVHTEHLMVEGQKMSKSLGNQFILKDVLDRGYRASAVRYLLLSASYRKHLNFTWAGLTQAEESLNRLIDFLARLDMIEDEAQHQEIESLVETARKDFREALDDDLNTAQGLAVIFDLVRASNAALDRGELGRGDGELIRQAVDDFDRVFGVISLRRREDAELPVPQDEIERLIDERRNARSRRDFATADRIRNDLAERGVLLEDTPVGVRWKRK